MKKKLITAGLAAALVLSCQSVAMAETSHNIIEKREEKLTHDVYAIYAPIPAAATVYAVEITWGSMEFTYTAPTVTKTWDPKTHTYTSASGTEGKWTNAEGANEVSLISRTNKALTAVITPQIAGDANNDYSEITATAADATLFLKDASIGATTQTPGIASEAKTTISLAGELTNTSANKTPIGSVTVTIKDAEEVQP